MKRSPWLYVCAVIPLVIGAFLLRGGGTIDTTARFPQLSLNGQTNIVSDNGSMWTFNGVPFCTNCGGGLVINPGDTYVPYRIDATTFGDSWFYRLANGMGINTNLYWGPGQTNVLYRTNGNSIALSSLGKTNGFNIVNTNGTQLRLGFLDNGSAPRLTTPAAAIWLGNNVVFEGNVLADQDNTRDFGNFSSSGAWRNMFAKGTNYTIGANDGLGNFTYLRTYHGGTGDSIHFDSESGGTAGPPRDFTFSTNNVLSYRIPGISWDDSQVPEAMVRSGATAPTLANFNGGPVQTLQFQNNRDDTIMATVQMTHRWKQGTDIHPHVHWCETAATGAGTNIVWQLTYAWTNLNCAYPAYTTLTITNSITGTNWFSQLSDFPDISGTGHLVSSIFVFELKRLANSATADDYNQNVAFLGFDIHHQVDSPGSDSELTKSF